MRSRSRHKHINIHMTAYNDYTSLIDTNNILLSFVIKHRTIENKDEVLEVVNNSIYTRINCILIFNSKKKIITSIYYNSYLKQRRCNWYTS